MRMRPSPAAPQGQRGATLIEVLVSLVILMLGLLGLVGVMVQSQRAQLESYQRVQALMLVQDMASRMAANKSIASCYILANFIGTGNTTVPTSASCTVTGATLAQKNRMERDMTEWRDLLLGTSEAASGSNVGGVLGARGCVTKSATGNLYQVSLAWQGSAVTSAPPTGIPCAQGQYGADDGARRAVSISVELS